MPLVPARKSATSRVPCRLPTFHGYSHRACSNTRQDYDSKLDNSMEEFFTNRSSRVFGPPWQLSPAQRHAHFVADSVAVMQAWCPLRLIRLFHPSLFKQVTVYQYVIYIRIIHPPQLLTVSLRQTTNEISEGSACRIGPLFSPAPSSVQKNSIESFIFP